MESTSHDDIINASLAEVNSDIGGWESVASTNPNLKHWKKPNEAASQTQVHVRMENTFENISSEALWAILIDHNSRVQHDDRWVTPKLLTDNGENGCQITIHTPKPPIPIVAQRELVAEFIYKKNHFGEGKHLICGKSFEHPDVPIKTGMMDYVRGTINCWAQVIEKNPNGEGSLLTEFRNLEMNGSVPTIAVAKMADKVGEMNYGLWETFIQGHLDGKY